MASATLTAVLKSGLRSSSTITFSSAKRPGPSRSISAAVGDAAGGRHALGHRLRLALRGKARHGERTLRHRVDLVVGGHQRGEHQRPAGQRGGIAERGDGDVDARALADEGRQLGGDDDGRDIARARLGVAHVDAHAVEHRLQRLLGERRVAQGVAGAVEADDQAVADELVGAHALHRDDVLDARTRQDGRGRAGTASGRAAGARIMGRPNGPFRPTQPSP